MSDVFDYYYGDESSQFSYYRIPRQLIVGSQFKVLSTDAKLLYGLLLDRMGLSARRGWYDSQGRVYIYYKLDRIQNDLCCGHDKAVKLLSELDTKKGIGLIERVKQGQGRPTKIYVKRFTTRQIPPPMIEDDETTGLPLFRSPDFGKTEVKESEIKKSALPILGSTDFGKADSSYLELNQPQFNYINPSINPSTSPLQRRWIDRYDCIESIREQIGYSALCNKYSPDELDEVVELIADVLCSTRPSIRIAGEDIPTGQVQDRFLRLDMGHMEYVFSCMSRNNTQVRNIRAYMLTVLYNAPATINHYYQAEIQHDFGPNSG